MYYIGYSAHSHMAHQQSHTGGWYLGTSFTLLDITALTVAAQPCYTIPGTETDA